MHNFNFDLMGMDNSDSVEDHRIFDYDEPLHSVIRRGILMANFRVSTQGEDIYINFGGESYRYPKPNDDAIQRIVDAFRPRVVETPPELENLPLDEARFDG